MRFFFYGTLMDPDVLGAVLHGGAALAIEREPARLSGWRRTGLLGASYPVVVPASGAHVDGVLASGFDRGATRRLRAYEGDAYEIARVTVAVREKSIAVGVFVPRKRARARACGCWDLATWQRRFKRRCLADLCAGQAAPGRSSDLAETA